MEQGDLNVAMSRYYRAAELLGLTQSFDQLFVREESLFDDYDTRCAVTGVQLSALMSLKAVIGRLTRLTSTSAASTRRQCL